jgi:hypothetical protein
LNWDSKTPDEIVEDLRAAADALMSADAYALDVRYTLVSPRVYNILLKKAKRRAQRVARRARRRRKKLRGW